MSEYPTDLADPDSPNYFRVRNVYAIRGALSELRDYVNDPGDFTDKDLETITNRLIKLSWPHRYPNEPVDD